MVNVIVILWILNLPGNPGWSRIGWYDTYADCAEGRAMLLEQYGVNTTRCIPQNEGPPK